MSTAENISLNVLSILISNTHLYSTVSWSINSSQTVSLSPQVTNSDRRLRIRKFSSQNSFKRLGVVEHVWNPSAREAKKGNRYKFESRLSYTASTGSDGFKAWCICNTLGKKVTIKGATDFSKTLIQYWLNNKGKLLLNL